ncbi:PAS domain-containing sensor histidine kinase [Kiloniella majae]|uniref:PAS domain-containing sensor histidine kinase n=1 Tax=Kiloniella majae TaxID=1938558 RepID=UPI001C3FE979|nr:PAS domain-containing sensor histidine kinase [Kiloniella majae]
MTIATAVHSPKIYNFIPWALSSSLCVAGFLYDWLTPLGVAGGLIYTVFILSGVFLDSNRIVLLFAGISSALTIFGYLHIPNAIVDTHWIIVLNRVMTIMVLWAIAYLAFAIQQSLHKTKVAQAHTEAIIKSAIDSIVLIDELGNIMSFNPASIKLFGYQENEVIGQNVKILMPENYAKKHDQYLKNYRTTGKAKIIGIGRKVIGRRKDGSEFPMDLSVGKVKTGSENLFIGIVRDITHFVEAEEIRDQMIMELSQSNLAAETAQARTKAVIDNAVDSMILIDRKGLIQEFNPASVTLFGYQVSEVIGQNVKMLMPENYAREHDQYLHDYQTTGKAKIIGIGRQVVGKRKDGSEFPIDLSVGKLETDDGTHFIGIVRDITERVELERARDKNIHDLTKSNQALDDFAYIASHDLKEPLRGLANNAMFFAEDYAETLDEDGNKRIDRMCTLTKRMEKLIDNLLYFSRLGRQDLAIRKTNINDVISEITGMIDTLIEEKAVKINIIKPLPSIVCDRHRIAEVFRNLITNAIKYNDKSEKIISIDFLPEKDGRKNVFTVTDNGIGIAPEYHGDIFKIFKRLNVEEEKARGTGVGLTFVQKIIERHGGEIWLESEQGRGTTFYFTINSREEDNDGQ